MTGDERYQILFSGFASGADKDAVKALVHERLQMPIARIESWFGKQRAVIGDNLSQDHAWKSQTLLDNMGVKTIVVQQTRSNLSLQNLQMEQPSPKPAVKVSHFQPTGLAEFEARPLSQARRVTAAPKRRQKTSQSSERSLKLSHMVAAAIVVVVVSYAGKQLTSDHSPMGNALAGLTETR